VADDISWVPDGVDTSKPSFARICDYFAGGSHNLPVIRFAVGAGIRQFPRHRIGAPTQQTVHEVAQDAAPGAWVVYVDIAPDTVIHANAILTGNPDAEMIQGDLREPAQILAHPSVRRLIDFSQPAGLVIGSVLHFLADSEEPWRCVADLGEPLAPGSYLIISHSSDQDKPDDRPEDMERGYQQASGTSGIMRSRAEIASFFEGFELVDPGLVFTPLWRPDSAEPASPSTSWSMGGVGRKR
jgi:S-adenosyl methyltransferase